MAKVTKATFKSFIKKQIAEDNLWIRVGSDFNPVSDMVEKSKDTKFIQITNTEAEFPENSLGIQGLWLVGGGRDYFNLVTTSLFEGIEVYNCCGSCIIAKKL